ncbi:MAG: sialate O-acetylesterase [Ruminococcaceae bacterium]|nr:sialate O-acetylesterase [Oscillospiraceae bacterium]
MLKDFSKEAFDVIIQAGQSNSEGYAFGHLEAPYSPDGRVWYMNENDTISLAVEKVAGNGIQANFSLPFAREYVNAGRLAGDRKLLILRAAVGGTGFLDNRWKLTDDLYLHMMEMIRTALALNPENRLVAFLWHQGETDAGLHATFDQHYNHLKTLVESVRTAFDVPNLPFIAGDFVHDWRDVNAEICAPVLDAIRAVCHDCTPAAFVETDGLKSNAQEAIDHPLGWGNGDIIHFSRPAIYELGRRYFEKFTEITG